ncbi:DHA2 family efflux MFS transporter permease subunit [Horticoccus luteus]|uniref:DHA2 family efflux MFS transporter permease subunit n=1 Tax=Horticoccus luteus TaxID=2862869 RepID=A0A8F9TYE6_9BACT|nr:DHA2 family efflux MFS transporter permease subunit [Horticoccus luteus]QYM80435.1 DHA2 family efflux MFS transporter permease subunit [Horticoccus luteus]
MDSAASDRTALAAGDLARIRRFLPWLVAMALFMENLDATIVNTAVPTMAESLRVEPLSLKAVLTSYTLSLAVFIPVSGWFADRFGTCRVFRVAIWLFLLGSLGCGLAPSVPLLVAARVLQGIGGAMMTPVARVALVRTFPRSEMLRTMNYVIIPALLGPLLGPFTGGLIVHITSWRVIFFVNIPLALFGLWMTRRFMPDYRDPESPPLDRAGFFLFCSGIALVSYVLEVFGEHSHPASQLTAISVVAVALLAGYGWHARRVVKPLLELALFKVRTFRVSVLGGFVTRLGFGGMPFLLPLLYQLGLGYAPWQAGLLTVPQALAAMAMKIISRPVLRRFGHRTVLLANTLVLGLTMMLFTQIDRGAPLLAILALSFTQGFVASLQFTAMNSLVYADIDDVDASKAGSLSSTAQQLSLSFGVALGSLIAGYFLGHVDQTNAAQTIPALHKAFFALGAVTIVSSLTFLGLHAHDGNNISNRTPLPPPRGQMRAESRAAIGTEGRPAPGTA